MSMDLTIREAIADGLIALVNASDNMDQKSFAALLETVAFRLAATGDEHRADAYAALAAPATEM
jgi:hypothetical protein